MYQASVVIPTHNRPYYLREALRSVAEQNGVDLDIIVVGDGAGEETAAVAAEFPSVRYVWQPQAGPNAARNRALALARHDYVALLDDDDLWLPGKLQSQLETLHGEPDAAYVFSDFHILREGRPLRPKGLSTWGIPAVEWERLLGKPIDGTSESGPRGLDAGSTAYYRLDLYGPLLEHPYVLPTTAVFRKSFLTPEIRFVDEDYICGDWEFFARLSRAHPALYMPAETACNRSHEEDGRLTRTPDVIQLQRRLDMLERVWATDRRFLADADNRIRVERTKFGYLLTLAKLQFRHGSVEAARESLRRARAIDAAIPTRLRIAGRLASIPGGLACLRGIDRAISKVRSSMAR